MTPRLRRTACIVLALAAGVAAVCRMAALAPYVDVHVTTYADTGAFAVYDVVAVARGGETIEELSIEPASGPVEILEGAFIKDLAPLDRIRFQVRVEGAGAVGAVRLVQKGRAPRIYDVTLGRTAP